MENSSDDQRANGGISLMAVMVPLPPDRPPVRAATGVLLRRVARFLAAISMLCAAAAFPASAVFDLQTVTVTGNTAVPSEQVLRLAGLRPGLGAFQVNAGAIRERLHQDPRIEGVTVVMGFPSRVQLGVRERVPVAAMLSGEGYALLSADGVVITTSPERGPRPVLMVDRLDPAEVSLGSVLRSPDARLAARVAGALPEPLRDRVAAVRVDGAGEVMLVLWDGISVRLGGRRGMDNRLEMVPQVLGAIATRGVRLESVDLRFPGSIVVRPVRAAGPPGAARPLQENPPARGIDPGMHRPSVP